MYTQCQQLYVINVGFWESQPRTRLSDFFFVCFFFVQKTTSRARCIFLPFFFGGSSVSAVSLVPAETTFFIISPKPHLVLFWWDWVSLKRAPSLCAASPMPTLLSAYNSSFSDGSLIPLVCGAVLVSRIPLHFPILCCGILFLSRMNTEWTFPIPLPAESSMLAVILAIFVRSEIFNTKKKRKKGWRYG